MEPKFYVPVVPMLLVNGSEVRDHDDAVTCFLLMSILYATMIGCGDWLVYDDSSA